MNSHDVLENRSRALIGKLIRKYELDLSGLTVFTEAATGSYRYTSLIAALAGAKQVYAVAADSKYGQKEIVKDQTLREAEASGVHDKITILFGKDGECLSHSDIVTNLGFVRPITSEMVSDQTLREAEASGVHDKITILFGKDGECLSHSDIVTNLGFVRPITSEMVSYMKPTTVISLMWLVSEFRSDELDSKA